MSDVGGAPKGNQNAKKGFRVLHAILKEAERSAREGDGSTKLDALVKQLFALAAGGEQWAMQEIFNRIDGKPPQALTVTGDTEGGPIRSVIEMVFREPGRVSEEA